MNLLKGALVVVLAVNGTEGINNFLRPVYSAEYHAGAGATV